MIELKNVSKKYKAGNSHKIILNNVSETLDCEKGIAIIGNNGAGKSTLVRLISGTELPDNGKIIRKSKISWPMGLSGTFQPSMTGRDNVKFVARIYDENVERVSSYVEEFAEIGKYIDMPVSTYSNGMKSRLAFGLSLAIDFDVYLIDEIIAVGDSSFKKKSAAELKRKVDKAKVILISHQLNTIKQFCDKVAILHDGEFKLYPTIHDGLKVFKEFRD